MKYKFGELIEVSRGASLSGDYYASSGKYSRLTCGNFDYRNNCFKENTYMDNLFYAGEFKEKFLLLKGDLVYQTHLFLLKSTANLLATFRDYQHLVSQLGEGCPNRLPDD